MISNDETKNALFNFALKHGDDRLILGHRVSEWCGHGPILEEDLAISNIALDMIGQSVLWLKYAGEIEGKSRSEDDLAYLRSEREFKNVLLTEQPNEDFAYTIIRQFFFDVYDYFFYTELKSSNDETLSGIALKSLKESAYHLRHSSEWVLRLGDGTDESHKRITNALNDMWMYTGELFIMDADDVLLLNNGTGVDLNKIKPLWFEKISKILTEATLSVPNPDAFMQKGGRDGVHSEYLGHILSEMQYLPRAYPNAKW